MIPEGGKASMRVWAAYWEAKAKELRNAAAKVGPGKARLLRAEAVYYEAASRAAYEGAFECGLGKHAKAEKRWLDATRHISCAESVNGGENVYPQAV